MMRSMAAAAASNGGRSTLNPNAPLFIPAAYQRVEDFSPEWWELVKTTPWFRDHWLRRRQERESFDGEDEDDVANLLPDSIDLGVPDEFTGLVGAVDDEAAAFFEAFEVGGQGPFSAGPRKQSLRTGVYETGEGDAEAVMRSLSWKSAKNVTAAKPVLVESATKHHEKPLQYVRPRFLSPRRIILQPR